MPDECGRGPLGAGGRTPAIDPGTMMRSTMRPKGMLGFARAAAAIGMHADYDGVVVDYRVAQRLGGQTVFFVQVKNTVKDRAAHIAFRVSGDATRDGPRVESFVVQPGWRHGASLGKGTSVDVFLAFVPPTPDSPGIGKAIMDTVKAAVREQVTLKPESGALERRSRGGAIGVRG